jgi:ankyrin repeat protein
MMADRIPLSAFKLRESAVEAGTVSSSSNTALSASNSNPWPRLGNAQVLQCLLQFFFRPVRDLQAGRPALRVFAKNVNMLHTLAQGGLLRGLTITPYSEIYGTLVSYFCQQRFLTDIDDWGRTPLQWALIAGDPTMSRMLIDLMSESDVNIAIEDTDSHKWTLLHYACKHNLLNLAAYLIDKGASVHARTKDYELPLHIACDNGRRENTDLVKLLLRSDDEDAYARRLDGKTPLHLAALHNNLATVQCLFYAIGERQPHCIHMQDNLYRTSLMLAKDAQVMEEFAPWHDNTCKRVSS